MASRSGCSSLTLRQLERDGLVARTVHPTVPPRVDYALTSLGQSVLEPIMALMHWAQEHGTDIAEARRQYEEDQLEDGRPAEGVAALTRVFPDDSVSSRSWSTSVSAPTRSWVIGGEAWVYALDDARVVRVLHPGGRADDILRRQRLVDELAARRQRVRAARGARRRRASTVGSSPSNVGWPGVPSLTRCGIAKAPHARG